MCNYFQVVQRTFGSNIPIMLANRNIPLHLKKFEYFERSENL